ncbi:MAG: hypothetical protein RL490_795 [Pseudomonadota bacterium]|jgi:hypothetical protein
MTAFTDFAENRIIDWLMRGQAAPALPANWSFGLLTAVPADDGTGLAEVAGGSYARASLARSLANFAGTQAAGSTIASSGATGVTSNNVDISFPSPTANWGTVVAIGIFDAGAGGNLWAYGALAVPKVIAAGDSPPRFPAGTFAFTLA